MTDREAAAGAPVATGAPLPAGPAEASSRASREGCYGWLTVAALTAVVAVSWARYLNAPLGDNHLGRITGRYALHLRNLREKGLFDSSWGADWSPYARNPYAHHPPLRNVLDVAFGALPGDAEYQLRLGPFLLALLAVPAAAALLRAFGVRWAPTLLATAGMAATPFFWVYAQVGFDLGPILLLSALVVHLRRRADPPRWQVATAAATAVVAALGSWPGLAFAVTLTGWLWLARRWDRVTAALAAATAAGSLVSLAYMFGVNGPRALAAQAELRTVGGAITVAEFLDRQAEHLTAMLPAWYLALAPFALVAGWLPRPAGAVVASVVAAALAVAFATVGFGDTARRYVERPADAGRLVRQHPPAAGQEVAWHVQLGAPRWLAYYWDLPPRRSSPRTLAEAARPDDLVVVNLADLPDWLPPGVAPRAVASEGTYGLFRAADLLAAAR